MRLILVIISFASLLAQDKRYSFDFNNIPLSEALIIISEKLGYDITFSSDKRLNKPVRAELSDEDIIHVLNVLLPEDRFTILIDHEKQRIIIKKKSVPLSGKIVSASTQLSVPYVNVHLKGNKSGTYADRQGKFRFYSLDPFADTLIVSSVGYETKYIPLESEETLENMSISLNSRVYFDTALVVSSINLYREQNLHHRVAISSEELRMSPVSGENDILDNLKYLSDVTAGESDNFSLSLNAGGSQNNVYLIDGIRIYNTDHLFGSFSVFDGDALKSINIYPINFPATYGNALSGVIELFSKEGTTKEAAFTLSGNILNINMTYGQKFNEQFNLFSQTRRSIYDIYSSDQFRYNSRNNTELINKSSIPAESNQYYYDHLSKLTYKMNPKNVFQLTFFKSFDKNNELHFGHPTLSARDFNSYNKSWGNTGLGLNWSSDLSAGNLDVTLSLSRFKSNSLVQSYNEDEVTRFTHFQAKTRLDNAIFKVVYDYGPSAFYSFKTGVEVNSFGSSNVDPISRSQRLKSTLLTQALFLENLLTFSPEYILIIGLRSNHISDYAETRFEPRITFFNQVTEDLNLTLSYSLHHEFISHRLGSGLTDTFVSETWVPIRTGDLIPSANHYSIKANYKVDMNNQLMMKIYQKDIRNDLLNEYLAFIEDDPLVSNQMNTISNGVNASLHSIVENATLYLSYDYQFIKNSFQQNLFHSFDYNRHSLKSLITYPYRSWNFSINYVHVFAKRLTFTYEDQQKPNEVAVVTVPEQRNDFIRLNLSMYKNIELGWSTLQIGFTVNNIFDVDNSTTDFRPSNYSNFSFPLIVSQQPKDFQGLTALMNAKLSF